jgi:hypothetical protein
MSAPMHVLHPSRLNLPPTSRVAFAPIVAKGALAAEYEQALLAQCPSPEASSRVLTATALAEASPIRLASTAPLTSDLTAIHAARQAQADLLLIGEVIQDELGESDAESDALPPELSALNARGPLLLPPQSLRRPERVAVAWRVFDVESGRVVGSHTSAIDRMEADRKYPDLQFAFPEGRERVIAASARQTWQAIAPYVEKEDAVLALPWFEPGASQVRRGNAYARSGRWDLAEVEWTAAHTKHPFSNSAKHNLAMAQAAREDFSGAKETLGSMGPLRRRKLQSESLVWLDARHRWHHDALGLPPPAEGFAFPAPAEAAQQPLHPSTAPDPEDLPLWTAIPFTKPPGWTWRQWLFQPWAL